MYACTFMWEFNNGKARNVWEFLFHHHHCHCLKEINPEYSLDGLMLKLQYFGHLMQRTDSFEKTLMLGMIEGGRRRGQQRMRWLDGIIDSMTWGWVNSRSWWWTGMPAMRQSMGLQSWTQLSDWTELNTWDRTLKITFHSLLNPLSSFLTYFIDSVL